MTTQIKREILQRIRDMDGGQAQDVLATLAMNLTAARKTVVDDLRDAMDNTISLAFRPAQSAPEPAQAEESEDENDGADTSDEEVRSKPVEGKKKASKTKKKARVSKISQRKMGLDPSVQNSGVEVDENEPTSSATRATKNSDNKIRDQQKGVARVAKVERKKKRKLKKLMGRSMEKSNDDTKEEAENLDANMDADNGVQSLSPEAEKQYNEGEDATHPSTKSKGSHRNISVELGEGEEVNASDARDSSPSKEDHKRKLNKPTFCGGEKLKNGLKRKAKPSFSETSANDKDGDQFVKDAFAGKPKSVTKHKRSRDQDVEDQDVQEAYPSGFSRASAKKRKANSGEVAETVSRSSQEQASTSQREQDRQMPGDAQTRSLLAPTPAPSSVAQLPIRPRTQTPTPGPRTATARSPLPGHHNATPPPPQPDHIHEFRIKEESDDDIHMFVNPITPFKKGKGKGKGTGKCKGKPAIRPQSPSPANHEDPLKSNAPPALLKAKVGQHTYFETQPPNANVDVVSCAPSAPRSLPPGHLAPRIAQSTPTRQRHVSPSQSSLSLWTPRGERRFKCKHCSVWFKYSANKEGSCHKLRHPGEYAVGTEHKLVTIVLMSEFSRQSAHP